MSLALFWYMALLLVRTDSNDQSLSLTLTHTQTLTNGMIQTSFTMVDWVTTVLLWFQTDKSQR